MQWQDLTCQQATAVLCIEESREAMHANAYTCFGALGMFSLRVGVGIDIDVYWHSGVVRLVCLFVGIK